jgi:polysaccharide chain length determinant protein (PEP-CTERM system associated)
VGASVSKFEETLMLPGKKYRPEDYLDILWRRKWLAIIPFVVISIGTAIWVHYLPNRYRSDARILIVPQQVPEDFVQPTVTTSLDARLQAISQQILSRTRLERIIQELNLYQEERETMIMEDVIELMRRDTSIQIPRVRGRNAEPGSFTVGFVASNARTALQVTERLASQFITESLQDRTIQADQTSQFLETQLEEARRKLAEHEQKFAQFRQRYAGELPTQVQSNLTVMSSTQGQLQAIIESINRDRDRQLVLDKIIADMTSMATVAPERPSPSREGQAVPPTAAAQLQAAQAGLRELQLRLKPEHPDVMRAQRVVRELAAKAAVEELNSPVGVGGATPARSTLSASDQKRLSELQAERESLDRRIASNQAEEARLQNVLSSYRAKVEAAPNREAESTELMRDYETLDEQYRTLLGRSQQSRIAADLERRQIGEQFRLIDPARLPERPISPDRPRLNMLGSMMGLALGLALIGLVEYRNTTFRTEEDFELSLALPVLAVIPAMLSRPELKRARKRRLMAVGASLAAVTVVVAVVVWKYSDIVATWTR